MFPRSDNEQLRVVEIGGRNFAQNGSYMSPDFRLAPETHQMLLWAGGGGTGFWPVNHGQDGRATSINESRGDLPNS